MDKADKHEEAVTNRRGWKGGKEGELLTPASEFDSKMRERGHSKTSRASKESSTEIQPRRQVRASLCLWFALFLFLAFHILSKGEVIR